MTDSEDFDQILQLVRAFITNRVVPAEDEIESSGRVPEELLKEAAQMGLYGYSIPTEWGGLGFTMTQEARLTFELGKTSPAFRSAFGTNTGIAGHLLVELGTDAQRSEFLPLIASGERIASFALTEPDAGSDPSALRTRATKDGQSYRISGSKRFITNAPVADVIIVFARTSGEHGQAAGISAFLVDADAPGITIGPHDKKMGQIGALSAEVSFDDVVVPESRLLGAEGVGFRAAMRVLSRGRIQIAAFCVGMAERLLAESVSYAVQRSQFGKPVASHQLIQAMIADSKTDTFAGRSMTLAAAREFDEGRDDPVLNSCCKYFCSESLSRVADRAVQIHGGTGYIHGVAVERMFRDSRLFRIYEGTSQIQQLIIARGVLKNAAIR